MKTKLAIVGLLCLLACYSQVHASLVTIEITGKVDYVSGSGLPNGIGVGSTFNGTYTFESTTAVTGDGEYIHDAPYGITLSLGGHEFKTSTSHTDQFIISVLNDYNPPYGNINDNYLVDSYDNLSLSDGSEIESISWWLMDSSLGAISSNVLPTTAPVLSDWKSNVLNIQGKDWSFIIKGYVTEATVVPEPMSLTLLLSAGLFAIRRKR